MADSRAARLRGLFRDRFGREPRLFRAPGRVNLIGEHTDYNEGFVMPAALEFATRAAAAPREDGLLRLYSTAYDEQVDFRLDALEPRPTGHWSDYARGVAGTLREAGVPLRGADVALDSDVPAGAGLSSSAALEVASGWALLEISGAPVDRWALAKAAQAAEHRYVGTRCGIMDQFASCFGRAGHALLLDCRSLEHRALRLPEGAAVVVCDTKVKHALASGEYNRRRAECESGVAALAARAPGVRSLRDVDPERLEREKDALPPVVYRRCRHVVTENARAEAAAAALERGDLQAFGRLMVASHESLRDDYEVSCRELDALVEQALALPGVHGARMTGGGFGGCTVNLVDAAAVPDFRRRIAERYEKAVGRAPDVYVTRAGAGAGPVEDSAR